MDLVIGLFNHTQQRAESVDIDASDVQQWLDGLQDEYTLECCELEGESVAVKNLGDLCTLVQWIEENSNEAPEAIADFLDCFCVHDLDHYHDAFTGCDDFSEYATEFANDCILCDIDRDHPAKRYFDYDAFERDLAYDFTVGIFVWRNV